MSMAMLFALGSSGRSLGRKTQCLVGKEV